MDTQINTVEELLKALEHIDAHEPQARADWQARHDGAAAPKIGGYKR